MSKLGSNLWAGLDLLTFFRNLLYISLTINLGFEGLSALGVLNTLARDVFLISLLFSAFFTFKQRKIGLWIYVVQLPLRIYFFTFSFTVLFDLPIRDAFKYGGLIMVILVPALELLRVWYSIKNYHRFSPKSKVIEYSEDILDDRF